LETKEIQIRELDDDSLGAGTNNCGDEVATGIEDNGDVMGVLDNVALFFDPLGFITST
jgi:hypothetical protein